MFWKKKEINTKRPIELGMVVQLRCGGPKMVIKSINDNDVTCIWFYNGELKMDHFEVHILCYL